LPKSLDWLTGGSMPVLTENFRHLSWQSAYIFVWFNISRKENGMTEVSNTPSFTITESSCFAKIKYRVKIVSGAMLKGAYEPEIMDFVTGYGQVIPGLEKRLIGHGVGEKMAFTVPAEEAFGVRYPELVIEKSKVDFHFPAGMEPYVGMQLPLLTGNDEGPDTAMIREIRGDVIVIDLNHPLSGAALEYDLEIIEARPAGSSDVCSEWNEQSSDRSCCNAPHEIVLGQDDRNIH
jgi:FKBP-type peptidyl-prolyl cis-trans isomerase SlyD